MPIAADAILQTYDYILKEHKADEVDVDKNTGWITYKKGYTWNPFYKAFFYGHFIVNNSLNNFTIGNENQFASAEAMQKYRKGLMSSGLSGNIGGGYNMPTTYNVWRISDQFSNYKQLQDLFGIDSEYNMADGQEMIIPFAANQLSHSLGGTWSLSRYNDVSIKVFNQGMNWADHRSDQNKMAQLRINSDMWENIPYVKGLIKKMLTGGPAHGSARRRTSLAASLPGHCPARQRLRHRCARSSLRLLRGPQDASLLLPARRRRPRRRHRTRLPPPRP